MSGIKPWLNFTAGAALGYLVVHPLIMLAADLMLLSGASQANYWALGRLTAAVQRAFHMSMLPWGLGYGLLCAVVGWLLAKSRQASLREQKLQGVMELAGAACHELNQRYRQGFSKIVILEKRKRLAYARSCFDDYRLFIVSYRDSSILPRALR